jgi:hypothetical protein
VNRSDLQALTQSPEWESYLEYLDGLKEAALRQMMQLDLKQHKEFIVLNARLLLLDQISHHFDVDVWDDGSQKPENTERVVSVDRKYQGRMKSFLAKLLGRPD